MTVKPIIVALAVGCVVGTRAVAGSIPVTHVDSAAVIRALTGSSPAALAGALRGYLVQAMPNPLYETSSRWGHKGRVARGLVHGEKNQGVWRRTTLSSINLPDTLVVDLRNVKVPEPGRLTFTAFLALDARVDTVRQSWQAGIKVYDVSLRARIRIHVTLDCEASVRLEAGALLVPDAIVRLKVMQAHVGYDSFVVEHLAGIGGEGAKILGDTGHRILNEIKPGLEQQMTARAEEAIVKAGDTKDVRVSLLRLFKSPAASSVRPGS